MSRSSERGQTLALNVIFLVVLIGMVGLVVDGGNVMLQRRAAQGTADAAAMAGVLDVTRSRASAEAVALDYAVNRNGDGVEARQILATGSNTASCGDRSMRPYSVCVRVRREQQTFLAQIVGIRDTQATAQAIATASQVQSIAGWLPIGVRENAWTSGTQLSVRPNEPTAVGGAINTPAGDSCSFAGGSVIGQVIRSERFGGLDACPVEIGQTIQTQTGVQHSQWTTSGFSPRLSGNTDTFEDVFQWDPQSGKYIVLKPDSPRIGIIPIVSADAQWPLSGNANIEVVSYALVYIGKRDNPNILAPFTGQGNNQQNPLTVWLTPVDAILPDAWDVSVSDYDPNSPSIVVFRLAD